MRTRTVEFLLKDHQTWRYWAELSEESVEDLGRVTVVEVKHDQHEFEYYTDAHIVFKVEFPDGAVKYYQKNGESSSYSTDWDGLFYEVKGTPKTVLVYERISG